MVASAIPRYAPRGTHLMCIPLYSLEEVDKEDDALRRSPQPMRTNADKFGITLKRFID